MLSAHEEEPAVPEHDHAITPVPNDVARSVGNAVGRILGHWPGGTDWDVYGCAGCGFAQVRFHSGVKLAAQVHVRGWSLPAEGPSIPRVLARDQR